MNTLSKIRIFFVFVALSLFLNSCVGVRHTETKNSIFDFSEGKLTDDIVYGLDGEWDFYWHKLIKPSDLKDYKGQKEYVPSFWTKYKIGDSLLPSFGYATYHTRLILPEKGFYALKLKRIFLAYNVFINDSLALTVGNVSANPHEYKPDRMPQILVFYTPSDTVDLTIQVVNYSHKKAGIARSIKFGLPKAISKYSFLDIMYDMFVAGALIFMALFFFVFYFYNKQNKSNLYFSLFLIIEVLVVALDRELVFFYVFPFVPWAVGQKIYYIATFFRVYLFFLLVGSFKENLIPLKLKRIAFGVSTVFSLFILFTPMIIYSKTLIFMVLFTLITLVYELIRIGKFLKEDVNLWFAFIGLLIILISAINDALFDYKIILTFYSTGLGLFLFVLLQAILISFQNSKVFNQQDFFKNKEEYHGKLSKALLTTPSYDLPGVLTAIKQNLELDKVVLFTIESGKLVLSIVVDAQTRIDLNEFIDLHKDNRYFDTETVRHSVETNKPVYRENKKTKKKGKSSVIALPLLSNGSLVAVVYFEKHSKMNKSLKEVIYSMPVELKSLINTANVYYNLRSLNLVLDKKVKERTKEIEEQKLALDRRNQELDEKMQMLEEQYTIQEELNKTLTAHLEEIRRENELLEQQNRQIAEQKMKIEESSKLIMNNILYANKILDLVTIKDQVPFSDYFHLDLPRNIVSGDFFWSQKFGDLYVFTLSDATGHGVPGALMRIFIISRLRRLVQNYYTTYQTVKPNVIFNQLRDLLVNRTTKDFTLNEGIDGILCVYDIKRQTITYSAAYSPFILIRNGEVTVLKGQRMPVGLFVEGFHRDFKEFEIKLEKGDKLYLFSDGFIDQFSEKTKEKYFMTRFKKYLKEIHIEPMAKQKQLLKEEFYRWKGNFLQIDDVSVFGAKI